MDGRSPCFHFVEGFAFRLGHLPVLTSGVGAPRRAFLPPCGRLVLAWPLGLFLVLFRSFLPSLGDSWVRGQSLSPWETMLAQGVFRRFQFTTLRAAGELQKGASIHVD